MKTKEEKQESKRQYYKANRERILQNAKDYYLENKDKAIEYQKEYQKEYRVKNKEKIRKYREVYKKQATNKQVVKALDLKLEELRRHQDLAEDEVFNYLCTALELSKGLFASELDKSLLDKYIQQLIDHTLNPSKVSVH